MYSSPYSEHAIGQFMPELVQLSPLPLEQMIKSVVGQNLSRFHTSRRLELLKMVTVVNPT